MYRVKNAMKIALVVIFFPFLPFLLLIVGVSAKNRIVALEGALYAALFIFALGFPSGATLSVILGITSLAASGARAFWRRDLWLDGPGRERRVEPVVADRASTLSNPTPSIETALRPGLRSASDLSGSLAWVTSYAQRNKHRLPADSYVTVLECCHTLDAVIDAECERPSGDARLEYELEAIVKDYLPTVLKNYLAIPADMVDKALPAGRTPDEELHEQLSLLQSQAEDLRSNRSGSTSARMSSTGNFLREKFGHKQYEFDFGIEKPRS